MLIMMKKAKQGAVIEGVKELLQLRWIGKYISEKKMFFGAKTGECLGQMHSEKEQ